MSETVLPPVKTLQPRWMTILGWILTILLVLVFVVGPLFALSSAEQRDQMRKGTEQMGWPTDVMGYLMAAEVISGLLFLIPSTATLGAILLTGYLGGAVGVHVRVHDPYWFIAVVFGMVVWLALLLREPRLRHILPLR